MRLIFKVFKSEIVEFLLENEDYDDMLQLICYKRLDLVKVIYSESNAFLKIDRVLDLAASEGLIEFVE